MPFTALHPHLKALSIHAYHTLFCNTHLAQSVHLSLCAHTHNSPQAHIHPTPSKPTHTRHMQAHERHTIQSLRLRTHTCTRALLLTKSIQVDMGFYEPVGGEIVDCLAGYMSLQTLMYASGACVPVHVHLVRATYTQVQTTRCGVTTDKASLFKHMVHSSQLVVLMEMRQTLYVRYSPWRSDSTFTRTHCTRFRSNWLMSWQSWS